MQTPPNRLIYFIVCQLGWFACVMSAARDLAWIGVVCAIAAVVWHLSRVADAIQEFKLLTAAVVIGGIWESALVHFGFLAYPHGMLIKGVAPYWILALWALFAIQLNVVFEWLKGRWLLAALLGAIAGPLSFRAGASLGAVQFIEVVPAFMLLAAGWAVLMPGLLALAQRWNGMRSHS